MGNSQEPQDFNISVMPSSLTPVHVAKAAEGLNLYDTASHQVSHFVPLKPGEVGIYVCGATVQSSPHIGHIRAAVAFDIVRRWFLKLGYKVTFVRNVTDIDDKILVKAAAAGQRWWARAYYYEREFTEAYNTLGVLPPTVEPRATGHMSDMIDLIQRILDNGHGYVVTDADGKPTGNVYFDVASWPHYGELTHQKQTSEVDEAAAVADRMARPWTPPVPTSTIRSTRPMPPPTSMIRVISPCGRLRRTPIPRTPVGRRRLAWAALAGTSNAPPCPTVTWAMASTFTAAAWICASPTTKTKWLRPVRPATPPLRAGCIRHG